MDLVYNFLKSLDLNNSKIVLGVSSGPDSMCLLNILCDLKKYYNLEIIVAHVNHKKRVESDEEEHFLEDYCKTRHIIFEKYILNDYQKGNFESFARNKRYEFFTKLVNKYQANYLMTAHHGDDLIETILMRLVRGSNLKGYQGISLITNCSNYKLVRPLLYVNKTDILEYVKDNNIPYRIDKTNYLDDYTRNRYRNHIINFLHEENESVQLKFLKFENTLEEANNYIDNSVNKAYNECYLNKILELKLFLEYDIFIQKLVIEKIFKEIYKDLSNISDKHTKLVLDLINNSKTCLSISLPQGIILRKEYGYLYFLVHTNNKFDYKYELKDGLVLENGFKFTTNVLLENGNDTLHINSSDVKMPLYVRNRKDGDFIELKGSGKRKIKDIFIDYKIKKEERDNYPIVVDSLDRVIWIPKLKKSKYDVQNRELCDIIFKCL